MATTIASSTNVLGRHGTCQVAAWQSGPLVPFRDPLSYGPGTPRWQIRHLPTHSWITESPDQARAEQVISTLLQSQLDGNVALDPDASCFHAEGTPEEVA